MAARPDHPELLVAYAFSAHNSGRFSEAMERWEHVREVRPEIGMAWCGVASNARECDDIGHAKAIIMEALHRFPDDFVVISEAARVLDRVEEHAEAAELWRRMVDHPPVDIEWRRAYARDLVRLKRLDEAKTELDVALSLHPEDPDLAVTRARLAMARQDWEGALAAWSAYHARYPHDQEVSNLLDRTVFVTRLARATEESRQPHPALPPASNILDDENVRALLLGFESIGGDCELGLVQRCYGAEPLGLLRWNTVNQKSLMDALAVRFEGMGAPENTELITAANGEHYVLDKRWHLGMHTFLFESEVSGSALFPKMCRSVVYLREKFLADLQATDKVIVYKSDDITLDDLLALHDALKKLGPVRLLNIKQARKKGPRRGKRGEIATIRPDLYVGFIDRMGNDSDGNWDIAFDDWIKICHATERAIATP